jgi:hypothetical protein
MTTSTTPPPLTPLPPAPLPTDAEAVFDAKAGASLTAQAVMVREVNTALAWQADSMTASLSYKNAAAESATTAVNSANSATASAVAATNNGAAQVALATTQASNAAASSSSAQVSAAAAGAAAGLPSFSGKDGFDVLRINSAKNGVEWGKVGQSVGDIVVTAMSPGTTYVLAGRISYLQSAYPDLYALIGPITDTDRTNLTFGVLNSAFPSDSITRIKSADVGGLIIALTSAAFCHVSTDNGVSWARRATPFTNGYSIDCLNGVFLVTLGSNVATVYRTVDGINWTTQNLPAAQSAANVNSIGGVFVVWTSGSQPQATSPDGIIWTARAVPFAGSTVYMTKAGSYLFGIGQTTTFYTSDGISWFATNMRDANFGLIPPSQIKYLNGTYYIFRNGDPNLYKTTTPVSGTNWTIVPFVFVDQSFSINAFIASGDFGGVGAGADCIVIASTAPAGGYWVLTDNATVFTYKASSNISNGALVALADRFISGNMNIQTATLPYRTYDKSSNFITPRAPVQITPLQTYVKGKLV